MTTFMDPIKRLTLKTCSAARNTVAGMTLDAAGEFQFKQQGSDGRG
jgi:hypothetical protein